MDREETKCQIVLDKNSREPTESEKCLCSQLEVNLIEQKQINLDLTNQMKEVMGQLMIVTNMIKDKVNHSF